MHAALCSTWLVLGVLVASTHGRGGTAGFGSAVGWQSYATTQLAAVAHYLRLAFWPHPLVFDYGIAPVSLSAAVVACALLVTCLAAWTAWALVRRPVLGFLGASFFAILATFLAMRIFGVTLNVATILIATTVLGTTENDQIHFFYHLQEGQRRS